LPQQDLSERFDQLISTTAHEFFHLWNVKRIRPQSLEPVDYTKENYTAALWFSEGVDSTVAEYILLRAGTAIFRIPDAIPTTAVVGAGCALTTVLHGLERATVALGDVVVIQGSGPVGLAALAVSLQSGASKVIVIGAPKRRLDFALEFGAHGVISVEEATTPEARRKLLFEQIGPYGADVVVECVGRPSAVPEGWELVRDGGKYLVLGQYANAGEVMMNPHTITRKQLQVIGSWGFEPRHVDAALRLLENEHWQTRFASEVTDRYSLENANEALQKARLQSGGKTVITP